MNEIDPRLQLAQRLRALREGRWPDVKITQSQLAQALGGKRPLSVPLISSWESRSSPRLPATRWIERYAEIFASARSFDIERGGPIAPKDMSPDELRSMRQLQAELMQLRQAALAGLKSAPVGGASDAVGHRGASGALELAPTKEVGGDVGYGKVSVFVKDDNLVGAYALIKAIIEVYSFNDVELVAESSLKGGSWFQEFRFKVSRSMTSDEGKRLLAKSEITIQAALLDEPQSRANEHNASAVAVLIEASRGLDSFVTLTGSILFVKDTDNFGKVHIQSKTLSPTEIIELERNPIVLRSPELATKFINMPPGDRKSLRHAPNAEDLI